jgi:hypothetical protein
MSNLKARREDEAIVESDFAELSAFSSRSGVKPDYAALAPNAVNERLFSSSNAEMSGAKIRFGWISVSASYTDIGDYANSRTLTGLRPPTQGQRESTIAFDLAGFRTGGGDMLPSIIGALAPSSIYVTSFTKETSYDTVTARSDRTTGASAGAYWDWTTGNASVDYWNYALDSGGLGGAYDSTGRGFDIGVNTYAGPIGFSAGLSYSHTDDLAPYARAFENSYDAYLSTSYKNRYLPEIAVEGGVGRYEYSSAVWGATTATYWSGGLGLDFSKFLWSETKLKPAKKSGLPVAKLLYRYYSEADHSGISTTPLNSHFVGMMFRASL